MKGYFSNIKSNFKLKHYINYIAVGVALVLLTVFYYSGILKRSSADLITQMGFSIILAVSLNLVVGFLGELSLGHAGFMCVGAYIGAYLTNAISSAIPSKILVLIIAVIVGGLSASVFGFIVGLPALRLKGDYLAIVTLAFGEIVRNICKNLPFFGGALGLSTTPYGPSMFIPTFIILLIMLAVVQNLVRSKHGRAITAIRDNEIAAKSMGINVTYYKLFVFVISAFFAGVAGVIYGGFTTPILYSFFSYNYSIEILVMVVLGGMGSIGGSIISATVLTYINFVLQTKLSGDLAALKYLFYAIILIALVIYRNAPSLKKYREKFNLSNLINMIIKKFSKKEREEVGTVEWDRVPTKISTDEILSADFTVTNYKPDKPDKPDKSERP